MRISEDPIRESKTLKPAVHPENPAEPLPAVSHRLDFPNPEILEARSYMTEACSMGSEYRVVRLVVLGQKPLVKILLV